MIEIPRALVRRYRAVLRASLMEGRRDWPLVHCRAGPRGIVLDSCQGHVAVRYEMEGDYPVEALAFRASVLADFEGRTDDPVVLEQIAIGKGRARWAEGGVPKAVEIETVVPDSLPPFPEPPKHLAALPAAFLDALAEAARTTARDPSRYALTRLQLRGKDGAVAATDGRQLLVQSGFPLPWTEDLLVPRVPAFGLRDLLPAGGPVGVGRTESQVAVRAGPWLFLLAIDRDSRFPDIRAVIPRASTLKTRLRLDPADAALLADLLPELPGSGTDDPVTLDLGDPPAVRARAEGEEAVELVLARSAVSGPPLRLCTNRCYLRRAVQLAFHEISVARPNVPLVCRDSTRTFVWMPLGAEGAIPPSPEVRRITPTEEKTAQPPVSPKRRRVPMPAPSLKPPVPEPGNGAGPPDDQGSTVDLLAEVEALRTLLQEAVARTGRLTAVLKHQRRQSRAVEAAMSALRQLRLGP